MKIDTNDLKVVHNPSAHRFEIQLGDQIALSAYRLEGKTIKFYHVEVPEEFEMQGIGNLLAKASLDFAREKSYQAVPACPFIAAYLRRHAEYRNLVKK